MEITIVKTDILQIYNQLAVEPLNVVVLEQILYMLNLLHYYYLQTQLDTEQNKAQQQ